MEGTDVNFSFQNFFSWRPVCVPPTSVYVCACTYLQVCMCVHRHVDVWGGPKCWHQCLSQSGFTFHSEAASLTEPILASLVISASPTSQLASGDLCIPAAWVLRRSQRSEPALGALYPLMDDCRALPPRRAQVSVFLNSFWRRRYWNTEPCSHSLKKNDSFGSESMPCVYIVKLCPRFCITIQLPLF